MNQEEARTRLGADAMLIALKTKDVWAAKAIALLGLLLPSRRVCVECGRDEDYAMEDGSWICHACGAVR